MAYKEAVQAIRLDAPKRIPHWEFISNPDFEMEITGINPYKLPQHSAIRMVEQLDLSIAHIPPNNDPISPLPEDGQTVKGHPTVRWGASTTWPWDWGHEFTTEKEVLAYEPLDPKNTTGLPGTSLEDEVALDDINLDLALRTDAGMRGLPFWYHMFTDEELSSHYKRIYEADQSILGNCALSGLSFFYNTFFMWPILTFGYELFLTTAAHYPDGIGKIMDSFGEISLKSFTAWSYSGAPLMISHDDICYTRGVVVNPKWLRKYVYPWYERLWETLHKQGIKVLFMSDGRVDEVVDDVFACGADGIMGEPYTDLEAIAKKYGRDKILLGNMDNRVLLHGDKNAIYKEVERCTRFGLNCPGYFYSVTNHIPYNVPSDSIKYYFDVCSKLGLR